MRPGGRFSLLAAALLVLPALCQGQGPAVGAPAPAMQAAYNAYQGPPRTAPSLAPPGGVQGSWIADDEPEDVPAAPLAGQAFFRPPLPIGAPGPSAMSQPLPMDMSAEDGSAAADDGCASDEDFGSFPVYGDLWADTHAHHRLWFKSEYLSWWVRGNPLPPLLTTSPQGTPQTQAGVLGLPTTQILFGNELVDIDSRKGGRLRFGYWLVDGEFLGLEGEYWGLEHAGTQFSIASDFSGGPNPNAQILARPFFNAVTGMQDSVLLAFPNFSLNGTTVNLSGSFDARTTSEAQSAAAMLRQLLWIDFTANYRVDLLGGYRFFRLRDSLKINDVTNILGGPIGSASIASTDFFGADNQFHGGEFGLSGQIYRGRMSLELLSRVALGNNHETVRIDGSTTTTSGGSSVTRSGGFLAESTNIGTRVRNEFTALPEEAFNVRMDVTPRLRASVGYNLIYLARAVRSGNQIDLTINPTQIGGVLVGPARPEFTFHGSSVWVQGVNFGLEYHY